MGTGLYAIPGETVVDSVDCTWCGADLGEGCTDLYWRDSVPLGAPHSQRWVDYWNATHEKNEQRDVYLAPWRRVSAS